MEELLHFCNHGLQFLSKPYFPSNRPLFSSNFRTIPLCNRFLPLKLSHKTSISLQNPPQNPQFYSPNPDSDLRFREKMLYLDSIGIDLFEVLENHPPIVSSSLENIKSVVNFMESMGFSESDFRRICGMCPEVLNSRVSEDLLPVFTFLLREVKVSGSDLRKIINRRPRLLACIVEKQLRPTLYYLQMLGISEVDKHTSLLSCSVEKKFIPRIEYFQSIGFSYRDTITMVRRFPQLFCYSVKNNFQPKFDYFVVEMGRELNELKEFPQYFSFSLENRIKPRHRFLVQNHVYFPLPVMLKTSDKQFHDRLELYIGSSQPLKSSPLWRTGLIAAECKCSDRVACTDSDSLQFV